jgi:hypothetical protein
MLGRKDFTKKEFDHGKSTVEQQLATYTKLLKAISGHGTDKKVNDALDEFNVHFCNNMVLALDRPFVHRLRMSTGKNCNPLNEVELLSDSLINNDGVFRGNNVTEWIPDQSVLKLKPGDPIRMTETDFERLSEAFFMELKARVL